ncbi:MAG: hypothetical protein M3R44_00665 [Candidatus Eremiobacteraeota bacterium]|nr:hypothetical protein [Candidatus Eremiobacteraeota bacterium]
MASTVTTVRLNPATRRALEADARRLGVGLSEYLRKLAESREIDLRNATIREQGRRLAERLRQSPAAATETDTLGTPQIDLPHWEGALPE